MSKSFQYDASKVYKTPISLLSPARDLKVGIAAINAGADAVYIGAPAFSARQAAGCSIEDIRQLCNYAHTFSAKVLVALNTLLTDDELPQAIKMAWDLYHAGADALIVQDFRLLEQELPPIRLHASTQCDNRCVEDVLDRIQRGFKRVVLARELSIEQIREIKQQIPENIELEAFVHGALCVCYSGRCYISEDVLGRSANRGNCAQLCRWKYDLLDKDMQVIARDQYALSLRDMDRSMHLKELLNAGVTTLKIEGRLKDEEYVRNITAYYRQLLDDLFAEPDSPYCRASEGNVYFDFTPNPEKTFHRSNTDYFLHGRTTNLANWDTPKSTGEYIGKVINIKRQQIELQPAPNINLHNGDGLCFGNDGFFVNSVNSIHSQNRVIISANRAVDITEGADLYRNFDIEFNKTLANSRTTRKLPVDIVLNETEDGFNLKIGNTEQSFRTDKIIATNKERAEQNIYICLTKLGDTPFEVNTLQINLSQAYFIPASVLNSWRRTLVEILEKNQEQGAKSKDSLGRDVVLERLPMTQDSSPSSADSITPSFVSSITTPSRFHSPRSADTPLMTCRYCILFEMGFCRKLVSNHSYGSSASTTSKQSNSPKKENAEPAFLRSGKYLFSLHFDCQNCQMTISKHSII